MFAFEHAPPDPDAAPLTAGGALAMVRRTRRRPKMPIQLEISP
jgi:hypothetical protein